MRRNSRLLLRNVGMRRNWQSSRSSALTHIVESDHVGPVKTIGNVMPRSSNGMTAKQSSQGEYFRLRRKEFLTLITYMQGIAATLPNGLPILITTNFDQETRRRSYITYHWSPCITVSLRTNRRWSISWHDSRGIICTKTEKMWRERVSFQMFRYRSAISISDIRYFSTAEAARDHFVCELTPQT
jgi:hypothetical protein